MAVNTSANYTLNWWEEIAYSLIFSLAYMLSLMPLSVLYLLSDIIYLVTYKALGYRVKVTRKNLTTSFPEKNEQEIRAIEQRFYHWLSDYIVETIKLMSMSEQEMRRRMTFGNIEILGEAEAKGQSVTLYLGHYCNWEWVTSLGLYVSPDTFGGQVYHILENRIFDKLLLHIRSRMHTKCVPMKEILRKRIECSHQGKVMIMGYISDQCLCGIVFTTG